ncbi:hypothetical protein CCACVL1_12411 [Corchorus capsularis]|uniref:Uncharacterized protein n=1 Tax=Corchorus capsularis TaxID=210143 RepID=A0A1R3IFX8_COCAP|nr:hypothetical protein CCACVL1_12411 [Corchorus capsularis]
MTNDEHEVATKGEEEENKVEGEEPLIAALEDVEEMTLESKEKDEEAPNMAKTSQEDEKEEKDVEESKGSEDNAAKIEEVVIERKNYVGATSAKTFC